MVFHCKIIRNKVKKIQNPDIGYNTLIDLIEKFAMFGFVHSDFNEFNLMIDNEQRIWVIDFPQMVSTSHKNADFYYNRDVRCIDKLFRKRFNFDTDRKTSLKDIKIIRNLDVEVKASGYIPEKKNKKKNKKNKKNNKNNKNEYKNLKMIDGYYEEQMLEKINKEENIENGIIQENDQQDSSEEEENVDFEYKPEKHELYYLDVN